MTYLKEVLCPTLQTGQIVVMDNLSAHKVEGVKKLIEATGTEIRYLVWPENSIYLKQREIIPGVVDN